MSNIPSTPADGNIRTDVVLTIAAINAPKATEVSGATSEHISCYITAGGFVMGQDQAVIADERECDTFVAEKPGRKSYSGTTITVIDNTGTSLSATDNAAVDILTEGTILYIVRRMGIAFDTAPAAAQVVDVLKVQVGAKQRVASEANSVLRSTFPLYVQDIARDVALAV